MTPWYAGFIYVIQSSGFELYKIHYVGIPLMYLSAPDFWQSLVWNIEFGELFFLNLHLIVMPAVVACKIQVWNRLKSSSSNLIFQTRECQKSRADR